MRRFPWLLGLTLVACQSATSSPPSPSATAATGRVDLVYVQDESAPRMLEMDWTGKVRGSVPGQFFSMPSPDGSRFLRTGDHVEAQDWQGHSLGRLEQDVATYGLATWADDGKQLCAVVIPAGEGPEAAGGSLWIGQPGRAGRVVGHVGKAGSIPGLAACSVKNNRAVLAGGDFPHWPPGATRHLITTDIEVVDLTTGGMLYQHDYPPGSLSNSEIPGFPITPPDWVLVSASPDGRYLAESGVFNGKTIIRDAINGKPIAQLEGTVVGFSSDGSRVVVRWTGATTYQAAVISWAEQRIIWQSAVTVQGMVARPASADVMLSMVDPVSGLSDLMVVNGTGPATTIAHNVMMVGPCPCPAGP